MGIPLKALTEQCHFSDHCREYMCPTGYLVEVSLQQGSDQEAIMTFD